MVNPLQRLLGLAIVALALAVGLSYTPDRPVQALVARWAPPPSDFIDLDGQLVHLRDEGPRDDPLPIVLLHGTSASLHTWEGWAAALRGQRRVIRMDLPGFGLTGPSIAGDYHGDTYARFVLRLLDRLQVQRFVVAGNSLGGEIAWRTAWLAPQRVAQLVLVDAAGYPFRPQHMPLGFRLARMPVVNRAIDYLTPRSLIERSLRDVYGDPSKVTAELVDRYYELTLREGNRHALGQRFQQMEHGEQAPRISTLHVPTLVIWGGRDHLVPVDNAEHFHRDIAGSRLVVFDDLGHVPQEEDPQRTVQALKAFLLSPAPKAAETPAAAA
jgi:pimeloyl-ACP methyl ester carboxylesterase